MKIIKTLLFTLGFFLILLFITPFFIPEDTNPYAVDKSQTFNGVFAENDYSLDVLYAGDSEAYANFMPMELWGKYKIKAYNIGVPSVNVRDSGTTVSQILEKQTPQVLVIETNHFFKDVGNWTSTINHTLISRINKYIPIINYHDNWKQLLTLGGTEPVTIQRNPLKGWRLNAKKAPFEGAINLEKTTERKEVSTTNLEYIEQMIMDAQNQGITVLLVSAPSAKNWSYPRHNTVEDIAKKMKVNHLDFNLIQEEIGIDWKTDTYDRGDHVNMNGAKKVSAYITDYLMENYDIKVTATEEETVLWNQDLSKYHTSIKKR